MSQDGLRTRRLRLGPLADEHLAHEIELDADPEVMRYLGSGRARTADEVRRAHQGRLADAGRVPGLGFWAGFLNGGNEFVGWWILEPRTGRTRARWPARPSSATGCYRGTGG